MAKQQREISFLEHDRFIFVALRRKFRMVLKAKEKKAAEYMVSSDVAEMALAHAPKNQLIATYNKYDYFRERHEALCLWNEYLCRMLPNQFLTLIRGIDTEQCSKFRRTLEEKEKTFSE